MVYHAVNKSIAGFEIFNNDNEYRRIITTICYYQWADLKISLSDFLRMNKKKEHNVILDILSQPNKQKFINIISYCPMPTHLHIMLEPLKKGALSLFMSNILNSYTRYFNIKHKRKGPLWEGTFKKISIKTDSQLLHVTRYIHLNPVTAYIVDKPEAWPYSSYGEYISQIPNNEKICTFNHLLDIKPDEYKKFTEDQISYQRELAKIKKLALE